MGNNSQAFDCWKYLRTIGASWFVSFCYFNHIDKYHLNWNKISTASTRITTYKRTTQYHKIWLEEVLKMDESYLSTNKIGLTGNRVKEMASELLKTIN